jgi:hypothetical protein
MRDCNIHINCKVLGVNHISTSDLSDISWYVIYKNGKLLQMKDEKYCCPSLFCNFKDEQLSVLLYHCNACH